MSTEKCMGSPMLVTQTTDPPTTAENVTCGDSECLCKLVEKDTGHTTDHHTTSINVDEIYQVLGRDVLKSSLLDDIELYLECEEDSAYDVPNKDKAARTNFFLPQIPEGSNFRFKVTFPQPPPDAEPQRFKCEICTQTFTRESLLKDHCYREHGKANLFPCSLCKYRGSLHRHLQKHINRAHSVADNKPEIRMGDEAITRMDTPVHNSNDSRTFSDECPGPHFQISGPAQSIIRTSIAPDCHRSGTEIPNNECHVEILQVSLDHIPTSAEERIGHEKTPFMCQVCNRQFKTLSAVNEHTTTVHGNKVHKCSHLGCTKRYALIRDLNAHEVSHTDKFTCNWPACKKTFRDSFNLSVHRKSHFQLKDKKCLYCQYVCIQKNSLDWHMKKKHHKL